MRMMPMAVAQASCILIFCYLSSLLTKHDSSPAVGSGKTQNRLLHCVVMFCAVECVPAGGCVVLAATPGRIDQGGAICDPADCEWAGPLPQ